VAPLLKRFRHHHPCWGTCSYFGYLAKNYLRCHKKTISLRYFTNGNDVKTYKFISCIVGATSIRMCNWWSTELLLTSSCHISQLLFLRL